MSGIRGIASVAFISLFYCCSALHVIDQAAPPFAFIVVANGRACVCARAAKPD
jgi:hypothetical protein